MDFQAPKKKSSGFNATPMKTSSGRGNSGNGLQILIKEKLKKQREGSLGERVSQAEAQFPGGFPAGSKLNVGEETSANIPLNRELTGDERSDVASANVIEPHFNNIVSMINQGYLDSQSMGPVGRTAKQGIVDFGNPLLTAGRDNLQSIQSEFNKLKSKLPFDSGGKQLTGTEKALVFKLMNTMGKSNETIIDDLNFAMNILREKRRLALGGSLAGQQSPISGMSDSGAGMNVEAERQKAIQAINNGKDRTKVAALFKQRTGQDL